MDSYNIDIFQGDTFNIGLRVKDDDGLPLNLSGFTLSGVIKNRYSSISGLGFDTSIDNAASGLVTLGLSAETTAAMPATQFLYELEAYSSGSTLKLLRGYVNIFPEIVK